ncbi:hypothetical protein FQN60_004227 [Etheostoma spectabile]|uniref:Uncharacterized protein n=1 Tax=Etheostoma spectabile TaxID=54343 RepID=A0A5J5CXA6_9PERO|nr:hypothetical protein FQN60_004227 [Etheostoma spectabile]
MVKNSYNGINIHGVKRLYPPLYRLACNIKDEKVEGMGNEQRKGDGEKQTQLVLEGLGEDVQRRVVQPGNGGMVVAAHKIRVHAFLCQGRRAAGPTPDMTLPARTDPEGRLIPLSAAAPLISHMDPHLLYASFPEAWRGAALKHRQRNIIGKGLLASICCRLGLANSRAMSRRLEKLAANKSPNPSCFPCLEWWTTLPLIYEMIWKGKMSKPRECCGGGGGVRVGGMEGLHTGQTMAQAPSATQRGLDHLLLIWAALRFTLI